MASIDSQEPISLGFITVIDHEDLGCIGGYLILNLGGRPLEFHCTAPVRANRAQQILYGVSLKPFLYGELIGQALVERGSKVPTVVCADQLELLPLQAWLSVPVVHVASEQVQASTGSAPLYPTVLGDYSLSTQSAMIPPAIVEDLGLFMETIALCEPFGRIRAAIEEARRGARAA